METFPAEGALPLALEEIAFRLNATQGLAGMDRRDRAGILLRDLMADRSALAAVLAEHEARLDRITWALYQVQRAVISPRQVPRRIVAVRTGTRSAMEAAVLQLGTCCELAEQKRVRRAWRKRRGSGQPTAEEFFVAAPFIAAEKHRPGFWARWAEVNPAG
ncbi:hypothetical protein [Nonomuraea cavernae]|uniref:Uncharacterized protein n=1 Tax=Nonomuraea cavernae TaxID=2045107 RepID=A0A918DTD1_9ACTN|nr:hypothetical protein [Nonomuraea cavernae]MCA2190645.1 hypothetical protein [Nonomuraea cavernae]GGO81254.1 hypothetical protein GCM10012289_69800 [Nonomuraea cavernae]